MPSPNFFLNPAVVLSFSFVLLSDQGLLSHCAVCHFLFWPAEPLLVFSECSMLQWTVAVAFPLTCLLRSPTFFFFLCFMVAGKQWSDPLPPLSDMECVLGAFAFPSEPLFTPCCFDHRYDGTFRQHIWRVVRPSHFRKIGSSGQNGS